MLGSSWMTAEHSWGASLLAFAFSRRTGYRLHDIVIGLEGEGAVAKVYDGTGLVYEAHGFTEADALERAHQWVDEQADSLPAFDLHVG